MTPVFEALAKPVDYPAHELRQDLTAANAFAQERQGESYAHSGAAEEGGEILQRSELSGAPAGWFFEYFTRKYQPDTVTAMTRGITALAVATFIKRNAEALEQAGVLYPSQKGSGWKVQPGFIEQLLKFAPAQIDREPQVVLRAVLDDRPGR